VKISNKLTYILLFSVLISGCASKRNIVEFKTETGTLKCAEPPPDVIATGVEANVEALIPEIDIDVKANASASNTVKRIRSEIPNLQAVEALEYRMCLAYGNGIIDSESYKDFITSILPMLQGIDTEKSSKNIKKELTDYDDFMDIPIQYGDITALKVFEQKWKTKLINDGNPNAAAKAFLITTQLVEISWGEKKRRLTTDQRIAELRESLDTINQQEKEKAEAIIVSLQHNISVQPKSREYQLLALYGNNRSVNNPVDTMNETNFLTSFTPSIRQEWYNKARLRFSQVF
jgi:hypothetical protein